MLIDLLLSKEPFDPSNLLFARNYLFLEFAEPFSVMTAIPLRFYGQASLYLSVFSFLLKQISSISSFSTFDDFLRSFVTVDLSYIFSRFRFKAYFYYLAETAVSLSSFPFLVVGFISKMIFLLCWKGVLCSDFFYFFLSSFEVDFEGPMVLDGILLPASLWQ